MVDNRDLLYYKVIFDQAWQGPAQIGYRLIFAGCQDKRHKIAQLELV